MPRVFFVVQEPHEKFLGNYWPVVELIEAPTKEMALMEFRRRYKGEQDGVIFEAARVISSILIIRKT